MAMGTDGTGVAALEAELAKVRKQLANERARRKAWERRVVTRLGALEAAHVLLAGMVDGIEDDVTFGAEEFAAWRDAFAEQCRAAGFGAAAPAGSQPAPRQSRVRMGVEVRLVPTG